MIILNQDFFSNFSGSIKSKDSRLTRDLLLNEISDIIAYDEKNLISLLNKAGITTQENTSDEKLVEKVVDNLPNNEKLQRGIAFMIADNHDLMKIRVTNKKDGTKKPATKETYRAIIDKIYEGMKPTIDDLKKDGEGKKMLKEQITSAVKEKCKTSGIIKPANKKIPKWVWWSLGGLAVAGTGFLIWKYGIKPKMDAKKLVLGGGVTPAVPVVPPLPTPVAMPAPAQVPVVAQPTPITMPPPAV